MPLLDRLHLGYGAKAYATLKRAVTPIVPAAWSSSKRPGVRLGNILKQLHGQMFGPLLLDWQTRTQTNARMRSHMTHKGECFCGTVQIEVSGTPEAMGYCHCRSCRSWSGGPVNAFTLWNPSAVQVTAGAEHVGMFEKTAASERKYCKKCGGHLMTNHPLWGLVDVFAATLPTLKFSPGVHVNYVETALPMRDGLPKFKDFPAEFGGSGEQIAE